MSCRSLIVFVVVVLLAVAAAPAAAGADVGVLPQVPDVCLAGGGAPHTTTAAASGPSARAAGSGPTVRRTIRSAVRRGLVAAEDAARYEQVYERALSLRRRLGGTRRAELSSVVERLESFARGRLLTVSRMPALFLQLEVNADWWAEHDPPTPPPPTESTGRPCAGGTGQGGARVVRDEIVLQWYSGQGLQIQQLGTAGRANALVKACLEPNPELACDHERVRAAMEGLVTLAADRGGFRAWEYYFAFGGGSPPWISGLAQGTAMQALARGFQVLGDPRYLAVARSARRAFERRPPRGVRVRAGDGVHYLIYSFDPGLRVLNGFLQALVGLHDYAEIADDDVARRLFRDGERRARDEVPAADTGAWSRYSAGGSESDLGYHRLVRDFLRSLCERTERRVYCRTARRFEGYLHEPAKMRFLPAPRPRARRTASTRFFLTKVACVTLRVKRGGRRVATVTQVLGRGARTLTWTPSRPGTYDVVVEARDLVGHRSRIAGEVRVRR